MLAITRRRHVFNLTTQNVQFEIRRNVNSDNTIKSEKSKKMPDVKDPQQIERRRQFWEQEKEFESNVDYTRLNDFEKMIHKTHADAVTRGHFTYDDPENGDRVFTRLRHFLKGSCCGSACRHCIYDHVKVPEIKKKGRKFNTAYWTYDDDSESNINLSESFNKVKPLARKKNQTATQKLTIPPQPAPQDS